MPVTRISASGRLLGEGRRRLMDGALAAPVLIGPASSTGSPITFDDASERLVADRDGDGLAGVGDFLAAHQAFRGVHGDGAHRVLAQMLGDLEHQALALVAGLQRVQDLRQMPVELHVDDGAHDLARSYRLCWMPWLFLTSSSFVVVVMPGLGPAIHLSACSVLADALDPGHKARVDSYV